MAKVWPSRISRWICATWSGRCRRKKVAVPVRLAQNHIGDAILLAARTRPKFIGGDRAHYDETLKEGYPEF